MVQGGGFSADMTQKPDPGVDPNEADNGLRNARGTVAMARTNDPHSASLRSGSLPGPRQRLPQPHRQERPRAGATRCSARWSRGWHVVDSIAQVPTGNKGSFQNVPTEPVVIQKVREEGGGVTAPAAAPKPATAPQASRPAPSPPPSPRPSRSARPRGRRRRSGAGLPQGPRGPLPVRQPRPRPGAGTAAPWSRSTCPCSTPTRSGSSSSEARPFRVPEGFRSGMVPVRRRASARRISAWRGRVAGTALAFPPGQGARRRGEGRHAHGYR